MSFKVFEVKVYLLLNGNDENIKPVDMILLSRKKDADFLIKQGIGTYYETIEVLSGYDMDKIQNKINGVG